MRLVRAIARVLRCVDRAFTWIVEDRARLACQNETVPPHPPGPVTQPAAKPDDAPELGDLLPERLVPERPLPLLPLLPERPLPLLPLLPERPLPLLPLLPERLVPERPLPLLPLLPERLVPERPLPLLPLLPERLMRDLLSASTPPTVATVHHWPGDREAPTSCCGTRPCDLPAGHGYSPNEGIVTCAGDRR